MEEKNDALEQAILDKIAEMEDPGYVFPKRFSRGDYVLAIVCIVVCAVLLIAGRFF